MDPQQLSMKYTGVVARQYDRDRVGTAVWNAEQRLVRDLISRFRPGETLLDIPIGTGRFLEQYKELKLNVTGIDVSQDMLSVSAAKAGDLGVSVELLQGSIYQIPAPDEHFDHTVCIRLLNWIEAGDLKKVIVELKRVTKSHIVIGLLQSRKLLDPADSVFDYPRRLWKLIKRAVRPKVQTKGFNHHDTAALHEILRELGLEILEEKRPKSSPNTPYKIYLLKK